LDLYSYNIEQAAGHGGHNVITVVMNERGVDLNAALGWVAEYHVLSVFQAQYRLLHGVLLLRTRQLNCSSARR